jgi:segregation and condensation protein B
MTTNNEHDNENLIEAIPISDDTPEEPDDDITMDESDDFLVQDVPVPSPEDELESFESEIENEEAIVESVEGSLGLDTPGDLKAAIECLLFTTTHPLSLVRLRNVLNGIDTKTLRGAVAQLQTEYDARNGGLQIMESAEGFQMCTRPKYAEAVLRMHRQRKKNPLSTSALETLAIVAYKQPITRAEIEMIRGVESSGVLRNLLDMGMVKVVGRKEVIGRPQLYGTTSVFLATFGLRTINELPTLQDLRRRYNASAIIPDMMAGALEEASEKVTSTDEPGETSETDIVVADPSMDTPDDTEDISEKTDELVDSEESEGVGEMDDPEDSDNSDDSDRL